MHRGAGDNRADEFFSGRVSSVAWHSDVSYEQQPPGTTFLYILDKPETGGDTLFCNAVEAYNRLSPLFQERLHGLKATHSGVEQVAVAHARGSINRREPVTNTHPIVRTHPATGEKALYINPQCKLLSPTETPLSTENLLGFSHPRDRRLEERRKRRYPEVLVRPYRLRSRLPSPG